MLAILKVDVVDCVSHVSAPITRLVALEVGTPALSEAHLRTEGFLSSRSLQREELLATCHLLAPGAYSTTRWDIRRVCQQKNSLVTLSRNKLSHM